MAVVESNFTAMRGAPNSFSSHDGSQENVLWTEEPARLSDYVIFLGALLVSFGLLGFGFWSLFSYLFPTM